MTTEAGAVAPEQGAGSAQGTGQAPQAAAPAPDPWANPDDARAAIEALRKENAGWRTKVRDLEPLAAQATAAAEAQKSEAQRAAEQLAAAQRDAADAKGAVLRYKVAAAKGLPAELAARLQGATEEELTADAEQLLTLIPGQGGRPTVDLRQGARGAAPVQGEVDGNAWLRDLARKGGSGRMPSR